VATPEPVATPAETATTPPAASTPAPPALPPVTLTLGTASPDPAAPLPTVKIAAPRANEVIAAAKASDFAIKLDVKNWATATGAAHVHLILDNKPYKPIYDTKAPIKMSELSPEPLAEGQHVLVAFPSRPNHESVKTKDALAVVSFYVGKKTADTVDIKKPMLIFSRPKGQYDGELANHVLVDFYTANNAVGEGKGSVRLSVTGPGIDKELSADAKSWGAPFYLDNLQSGSYAVNLELRDKDGKPVPGPWNSTARTIKIDRDAKTPDPHAGHGAPPAAATATATAAPHASAHGSAPAHAHTAAPKSTAKK
jgi:hypothetical protein